MVHRQDVLDGRQRLDVVAGGQDVAPARAQEAQIVEDLGADIGDRFRSVALGVRPDEAAPVPEVEVQALVGAAVAFASPVEPAMKNTPWIGRFGRDDGRFRGGGSRPRCFYVP